MKRSMGFSRKRARQSRFAVSGAAISTLLLTGTVQGAEKAEIPEEVVVTGSYIKRDNFDLASPINVATDADIKETGAPNVGELLYNQSFNFGISRVQNFLGGTQVTSSADTDANLRGLGPGATLTLMNGKLQLAGNANYTYPQMAIQRVETLLDGASALYGSQAVAGVVNFIPYTKFDGIRVVADGRKRLAGGGDELLGGAMVGMTGERSSFVAAFEARHRDPLLSYDIPELVNVAPALSGAGNPGSFVMASRTATGAPRTTATTLADPGCGNQAGNPGNLNSIRGNRPNGILVTTPSAGAPTPSGCQFAFHEFWDYKTEYDGQNSYLSFQHDLTDRFKLKSELVYNRSTDIGRGSPINFGVNANVVHNIIGGRILGEHPGNPFRAFADANGDGVRQTTESWLYARDQCTATACAGTGDGIPDRDMNGDGIADAGAQGNARNTVVLAASPTDPASGIAFNEDVAIGAWRPLGKQFQGKPTSNNSDMAAPIENKFTFQRYVVGFEADAGESWTINGDYSFNHVLGVTTAVDASPNMIALGLLGKLGPNQDQYYNPFWTSQYQCVDRICGATPATGRQTNSQFVMDQVIYQAKSTTNVYQHTFDLVAATPDLFALPAGDVGFAVGAQHLTYKEDYYASEHLSACDSWSLGCDYDFKAARYTQAVFAQIQAPIFKSDTFGSLTLDLAGRYTEVEDKDGSFDPKVGLVYQPFDILSLRASWGTSYISPSLRQERATSIQTIETSDSTCRWSGGRCNPDARAYILNTRLANPNLDPETSESMNFGFTLRLLDDDLVIQGDWVNIDYTDRISTTNGATILAADQPSFLAFIASQCGAAAVTTPATADQACLRTAHTTWTAHTTTTLENPLIVRSAGILSGVSGTYFNAAGAETTQIDLSVRYGFDVGNLGRFNVGVQGTYIDSFEVQDTVTSPKIRYVGKVNEGTNYPALPRFQAVPRVQWSKGNHSVVMYGNYHNRVFIRNTTAGPLELPSYIRFNLAYSHEWDGLWGAGSHTTFKIGSENVTDKEPYKYNTNGGYNSQLEDPIGRTLYINLTLDF